MEEGIVGLQENLSMPDFDGIRRHRSAAVEGEADEPQKVRT